ncbi:MAG TPA: glycosyltransferase family 2 protein [Methylomirabilota bacterium]|nr:glycosyltransferase family 2 protein [Methylomirabilota bacterium]
MELSVVLPVFNEAENLPALHEALTGVLDGLGKRYELLYVDDGSTDGSFTVLGRLADKAPHVRLIRLRRNYGQTAAISAGIAAASGRVLCVLDSDGQNDPRDIPRLLARLDEGFDVVSGWRKHRKDPWLSRRLPSAIANRLISWITGVPLHDYGCTLKVYRVAALEGIRLYGEMHRLIPAFAAHEGARVGELAVDHHPRRAGRSSYGIDRTLKVILDLIVMKFLFGYATKPIYVFGAIGVASCLAGVLAGGVTVIEKLLAGVYVHRNPLILLAVFLFLLGVQCVLMGLLAELLIRTYHESQRKATYVVAERVHPADGDSV